MSLFKELKLRNLIKDCSNEKELSILLEKCSINFYCGFDPNAVSLTLGHLVQIIIISLFQKKGHKAIILIGRATAAIGDPKEIGERNLVSKEIIDFNSLNIQKQFKKFLPNGNLKFVDNFDWISKINIISFLREYGKKLNLNEMLSKEIVSKRLKKGISYAEFSYMILQALDFYYLNKNHNVQLQFGGSDQWGNITFGLEFIRKMKNNCNEENNNKVFGMSIPLLLDNKGIKFGKSEKNTLWLDDKLTGPYEIYQYLFNTTDQNVINYLKTLTLLELKYIYKLEEETKNNPQKRLAQKELSKNVVIFLYGEKIFEECLKVNKLLFSRNKKNIIQKDFNLLKKHLFFIEVEDGISLVDVLVKIKLSDSKNQAKKNILSGSIKIFDNIVDKINFSLFSKDALFNKYILLTKKNKFNALVVFK
ncbi:tyrosine--tRNA ligase [Texas Phoenix palm phytoplasma]|uniref:Tyrosine--tRNA ligase n=1 Tax=Texas Phoenix palm phytoplasma TaxID=176709 RepID=A0ABS5BIF9_9MOLU|nr:tyrosine--tRNA ligase [Texas Phoenix palm phytoplasma]MBP3059370.1 tyrosine--tRNA ligase [Texas Phoenix palm phytoplasma]